MFFLTSPGRGSGVTPSYLFERANIPFPGLWGRPVHFHQCVGEGEAGALAPLMELSVIAQF